MVCYLDHLLWNAKGSSGYKCPLADKSPWYELALRLQREVNL